MEPITAGIILVFAAPVIYWLYVANVKGAPFVPTPRRAVDKMLGLARIKPGDKVYDIGCGDGRLVIKADQEYKAEAVGYEISPPVYLYAKILHAIKKTETKAILIFHDSRLADFSDADVIVNFMTPDSLAETWRDKLETELKPEARVISYAFKVKGWQPSKVLPPEPEENIGPIYLYEMDKIYSDEN